MKGITFRVYDWYLLVFLQITAVLGTVLLCIYSHIAWQTWTMLGVLYVLTMLGITMGYHRLWAHKSFKAHPLIQVILLLMASMGLQKSAIEWCSLHRNHHQYSDTAKDPHSTYYGFWFAHFLWFKYDTGLFGVMNNVDDLKRNPLLCWQNKYYIPLSIFFIVILPTFLGSLWGQPLQGFVVGGLLRVTLTYHAAWSINSIAHTYGSQPYEQHGRARNVGWLSLFTLGESYHNYHHRFPFDYRCGVRYTELDITKWVIYLLSLVHLTSDLKRAKHTPSEEP